MIFVAAIPLVKFCALPGKNSTRFKDESETIRLSSLVKAKP